MGTVLSTTSDRPEAAVPAAPREGRRSRPQRIAEFLCTAQAPYQAALFRIGLSAVLLAFLLREWPHRRVLYGDRSPLSHELALALGAEERTFTLLHWSGERVWFETVYLVTVLAALAVLLGWRTRTATVVQMIGVLSLGHRNTLVGDGGDDIVRIMVIYLVFTRCAEVWALDARRARGRGSTAPHGPGSDRTGAVLWWVTGLFLLVGFGLPTEVGWPLVLFVLWGAHALRYAVRGKGPGHEGARFLDACTAMLHNCALLMIAVQVCLVYATAGWYKIQGSRWQEGSALYYALHLDYFTPWPALSHAVAGSTVLVLVLTYGTVIVQVSFPFTLANRRVKNVLIAVVIGGHLAIVALLGMPLLSLAMVVCDALFLPTAFLLALGRWCGRPARRAGVAVRAPASA
ncbi:HTTM domain-containing protein [Streptomyces sp. NPDC052016]|uniref:HTTM domain-containing protein n=1 Tax=Streptomyces sp. NPDC052016 TaxID=3365680 RepID=UPI0037D0F55A